MRFPISVTRLQSALRATAVSLCLAFPVVAEDLPLPAGEVILTVSGAIAASNSEGTAIFDAETLAALGTVEIDTSTIWTEGSHRYTGVPLRTLTDRLGISEGRLMMTAINDYMIEVPVSDAVEGGPILAFAMDGKPMSVRDKGPIWLIYPFDDTPSYQSEVYFSRSIWQLDRIEAKP